MFLDFYQNYRLIAFLCCFCFPVGLLAAQFRYICAILKGDDQMIKRLDFITTRLRGFEAFFESGPQLTLLIFRVAYTGTWTEIQIASMCFSFLTLGSTAIFCDMLFSKLKDIKTKILHAAAVFPLYLTSVVFKLGSLTFTVVYLRYYAFVQCLISFGSKFVAAFSLNFSKMESIEMACSNMAVLHVSPFKPKGRSKDESRFQFMMYSSIISLVVFDITLVFLAVLFNTNPTYFEFWKNIILNPADCQIVGLQTQN